MTMMLYITTVQQNNNKNRSWAKRLRPRGLQTKSTTNAGGLKKRRCIRWSLEQLESFLAQVEAETGARLPGFIKDEFDAFLECGILAHGFLRLRCGDCGHDKLVAFSCKRRGFCPSCGARRMAQSAAHLVDWVIPRVPVRQ